VRLGSSASDLTFNDLKTRIFNHDLSRLESSKGNKKLPRLPRRPDSCQFARWAELMTTTEQPEVRTPRLYLEMFQPSLCRAGKNLSIMFLNREIKFLNCDISSVPRFPAWPADGGARRRPLRPTRISISRSQVEAAIDEKQHEIARNKKERWLVHQEVKPLQRPRRTCEGSCGPPASLTYSTLLRAQPMGSTLGIHLVPQAARLSRARM
jgi:hypothetical protein